MSRPLGKGEGSQWSSQHSWPGIVLALRLHPGFKEQKEGAGGKSGCTAGKPDGFEKRTQPLSPGVFVCEIPVARHTAAFCEG